MLLSRCPKVEELLVLLLAEHPGSTAKELHHLAQHRFDAVSLPAVYQELKKLEQHGVVMRHQRRYSLGLHWVLELAAFSDRLYDRYTEPDVLEQLPQEGEPPKKWKFHSISAVVPFWTHLVLCMAQQSSERVCYEYVDHVWFHLVSSAVESKFLHAMQNLNLTHYLAVGSDSYLDRLYQNEVATGALELFLGRRIFPAEKEHYLTCLGTFVLRISVRKPFLERIEQFYSSVQSAKSLHAGKVTDFITERTTLTLSIENNPRLAKKIKNGFVQILGLPRPL
ncbi:MAG: hypothetical protein KDD69_04110 [Bdellovibrionales bacterium]|nr:hypothetical protein [Bdellovibrionales bacterium]